MGKFDLEKYWDFRVWVKSQIAQLRALISEYQQSGGGNTGGSGSSDFDPAGTYPNMTVGKASKADTATRATNADNATKATSATTANQATSADTATNIANAPVLAATEDEQITVKVGNKTSNPLTVPYAQRADFATDLSGRVEATPEVFTYRPSAGDKSIKDDNAFIRRVKGNSVVFNQIGNPLSADGGWYLHPEYGTVEYGDNYIKITAVSDSQQPNGMGLTCVQPLAQAKNGHLYMMTVDMKPSKTMSCGFRGFADTWTGNNYTLTGNTWAKISYLVTCTSETIRYPFVGNSLGSQIVSGDTIEMKNLMIIDLTAMFGTGNEPTTVEEFRALYPNSYHPYNAGELRNLVCSGIKTVGFNEFNGTYARVLPNESYYLGGSYTSIGFAKELGGATETISIPSNRIYTPTQLGYIYATGTDICINLHHTGYRDGEYEPYKEVTHALPLSQITNGEPLRKAGGEVYDEINETEYIRRVGVRSYTTGDKDDAALLTDGTYTNYPLDEPIVKPIETPIDFNYYVEDFGTEEALLAEDSAPFSADIVYQFNATDQIRNNSRNIHKLEKSAFTPRGTSAQYIRGDGSYGNMFELTQSKHVNDGEWEKPDESDYYILILQDHIYSKCPEEVSVDHNIQVHITPTNDMTKLAEWWAEIPFGPDPPNELVFKNPSNEEAVIRIAGSAMTDGVNVYHLWSSDGGNTIFGDVKWFSD